MARPNPWISQLVERLRHLWEVEGCPASVIGRELGMTRSAVIGKARRLNLTPRGSGTRPDRVTGRHDKPAAVRRPRRIARKPVPHEWLVDRPLPKLSEFDAMIPVAQRRTIDTLAETSCRWPVGQPDLAGFFFCGGDAANEHGQPYCNYHARMAHARAEPRPAQPRPINRWQLRAT